MSVMDKPKPDRPWPLLALATGLAAVAGLSIISEDQTAPEGAALLAVAFVLLGAWTTLEILTWRRSRDRRDDE